VIMGAATGQPSLVSSGRRLRGRTFLYLLPCAYEDHTKLGIAADPMTRMRAFSSRYYEFFDLAQGWLVEADTEQEARGWETQWKRQLRIHAAPPPLGVPARAGGHTEWLRGASAALADLRGTLQAQGFTVHACLHRWVGERLAQQHDYLASGEQAALARFGPPQLWPCASMQSGLRPLRDALDAYVYMQLPLEASLSAELRAWHRRNSLLPAFQDGPS